jgi:hypothetical protein
MSARSLHLARALIAKLRSLEIAMLDDAAPDLVEDSKRRQETVAKVLLAEEGIEDFATTGLIFAAMPRIYPDIDWTDREMGELAEFLDRQLALSK